MAKVELETSREFIAASFQEPVTLADFAHVACLSPFHFHRLFVREYGVTPNAFRTKLRLEAARKLLAEDRMSVGEICMAVGYASQGTFTSLFTSRYGTSPAEFQRSVRRFYQITGYRSHLYIPMCLLARAR